MNPDDFPRIQALFLEAVDLEPTARAAFLDRACDDPAIRQQVERLIANDRASDNVLQTNRLSNALLDALPGGTDGVGALESDRAVSLPCRFGRYTVTRLIGRGGMGAVYEAEQDDPRRKVALKMLRGDTESDEASRRFAIEAHVLGVLQHPGIAQVYDARSEGEGAGVRPFFAMEFVEGVPITEYANARRLDMRDRLRLLAEVMDAVHYAHRKGVIHRDLKPDNILVTDDGQPKVLDFGVARVADAALRIKTLHTHAGQLVGTLAYMSPEQATGRDGDVDTRSDVYSLGVIGYELIAGTRPLDVQGRAIADAIRIIADDDPRSISTLTREAHGDVETILHTALRKNPDERYASVAEFAGDIRRFLANEPILARAPNTIYHLRKFARRHRGVVAATAAAFLALVIGLIASLHQAGLERDARALAEDKNATSRAIIDFLLRDVLFSADPRRDGREARVIDALDRAGAKIGDAFLDRPLVHAELRLIVGQTYWSLGAFEQATPHVEEAVRLRRRHLPATDAQLARAIGVLGLVQKDRGDLKAAERTLLESRAIYAKLPEDQVPERASTLHNLGELYVQQGRHAEAESLIREALAIHDDRHGRDDSRVITTAINLSNLFLSRDEHLEAEKILLELRPRAIATLGEDHPHVATIYSNLSSVAQRRGDVEAMERLAQRSIDLLRRRFGERSKKAGAAMHNLGFSLLKTGQTERAERVLRETVSIFSDAYGRKNAHTAMTIHLHGSTLMKLKRFDEAGALMKEALAITRRARGEKHPFVAIIIAELAVLQERQGNDREAERFHRRALAIAEAAYGSAHLTPLMIRTRLAKLLDRTQRGDEADRILAEGLSVAEPLIAERPNFAVLILLTIADLATNRGEVTNARNHLTRAERLFAESPLQRPDLKRSLDDVRKKIAAAR